MRLHIGKNHWGKTSNPVQSIFRLAGSDEDALTYALGFLLAHDPQFLYQASPAFARWPSPFTQSKLFYTSTRGNRSEVWPPGYRH